MFCVSDRFITRKLLSPYMKIRFHSPPRNELDYCQLLPESLYHHGSLILSNIIIEVSVSQHAVPLPVFPEGLRVGGLSMIGAGRRHVAACSVWSACLLVTELSFCK
jgi:hypothetical protein